MIHRAGLLVALLSPLLLAAGDASPPAPRDGRELVGTKMPALTFDRWIGTDGGKPLDVVRPAGAVPVVDQRVPVLREDAPGDRDAADAPRVAGPARRRRLPPQAAARRRRGDDPGRREEDRLQRRHRRRRLVVAAQARLAHRGTPGDEREHPRRRQGRHPLRPPRDHVLPVRRAQAREGERGVPRRSRPRSRKWSPRRRKGGNDAGDSLPRRRRAGVAPGRDRGSRGTASGLEGRRRGGADHAGQAARAARVPRPRGAVHVGRRRTSGPRPSRSKTPTATAPSSSPPTSSASRRTTRPTPSAARLTKLTGLPRERFIFNASHTHTGPVVSLDPRRASNVAPPRDVRRRRRSRRPRTRGRCRTSWSASSMDALKKLEPATLSLRRTARSTSRRTGGRRRRTGSSMTPNPEGLTDRTVPVLRVDGADGKLRAVVFGCRLPLRRRRRVGQRAPRRLRRRRRKPRCRTATPAPSRCSWPAAAATPTRSRGAPSARAERARQDAGRRGGQGARPARDDAAGQRHARDAVRGGEAAA